MKKTHFLLLLSFIMGLMSCKKDRHIMYYWNASDENLEINNGELTVEFTQSDVFTHDYNYDYNYDYNQILNMAIRDASIVLISPDIHSDDELYLTIRTDNGFKFETKLFVDEIFGIGNARVDCENWEFRNFIYSATEQLLLLDHIKFTISIENKGDSKKIPANIHLHNTFYLCIRN